MDKKGNKKYLWVFIILCQQLITLFLLFYGEKISPLLFSEKVAVITILIDSIFIWLASILRQNRDNVFKKIMLIISLTIWQYYFSLSHHELLNTIGIILQPFLLYGYTVEIVNLILYEQKQFKRKCDISLILIILISTLSYGISPSLFNFLYLFTFIVLHLYPLLLYLIYRSYFKQVIKNTKRSYQLFSLVLLLILASEFYGDSLELNQAFSNLGWYLLPALLGAIYYFRVIQDKLRLVIRKWLGMYQRAIEVFITVVVIGWISALHLLIKDFLLFFIVTSITILFILATLSFLIYSMENRLTEREKILDGRWLSHFIKTEEKAREDFSNYLHDDILQNIIAVKNLLSLDNKEIADHYVIDELNDLVTSIRDEIDDYHPILLSEKNIKENYQTLLNELIKKRGRQKRLVFNCSNHLVLPSPYDTIVYRFLKELTNNAIKYATSKKINLSLDIQSDTIMIRQWNQCDDTAKVVYGRGLKSIKETVSVFDGHIDIQTTNNVFAVKMLLPIDWKLCYENFID